MSRRSRGDGAIYQRSDGKWCGALDLGYTPEGKRRRKVLYGKTRAEVARKLSKAQREYAQTGMLVTDAITVEAWLNHWLEQVVRQRARPSTLTAYRNKIDLHVLPEIGRRRLDKLEPQHLRALDNTMHAKRLSPATRHVVHAIIRRALKVAHREGKVTRNVAELIDAPTKKQAQRETLTVLEILAILRAAEGDPFESRWLAALTLGLRQGEALGLSWEDVDFAAGIITVRHALVKDAAGRLVLGEPKTEKSKRRLPLLPRLERALRAHHQRCGSPARGLVWSMPDGEPIHPRRDWGEWQALLDRAGVRHVRLHDARHAAATLLAALGAQNTTVRDILGHSTTALTANVYQSQMPLDTIRAALEQMDERLALD